MPEGDRSVLTYTQFDDAVQLSFLQLVGRLLFTFTSESDPMDDSKVSLDIINESLGKLWALFKGKDPDP